MTRRVAIVGASAAGLAAAETLRDEGHDGSITIIGAEQRAFYDRPPLSKGHVGVDCETVPLRPSGLGGLDIDLRLGLPATGVDLADRKLQLSDNSIIDFDILVAATGVDPVSIPGGICLRTFEDALAIGEALDKANRVVVVGAGVLGGELAALAASCGKEVTMLDALPAPMIDRVGPVVSARLADMHARNGVQALYGVAVAKIDQKPEGGRTVRLRDGRELPADLVLVAVGARPAVGWLEGSGVPLQNGVLCNEFCEAAPGIYAAGDVANWFNPRFGRTMRIEHRMNATEQGMAVAANILGRGEAFDPIPYFWTDQHDAKIQVHGLIGGTLETEVIAGDPSDAGFVLAYKREGHVEGILGWNMPGETRRARRLVSPKTS